MPRILHFKEEDSKKDGNARQDKSAATNRLYKRQLQVDLEDPYFREASVMHESNYHNAKPGFRV